MNLDKLILFALRNDDKVVGAVAKTAEGIPVINANRNVSGVFPAIEFNKIGGNDAQFADDDIHTERHTYELVYYCENDEYMEIYDELKRCMRQVGFTSIHEYIDRNPYTNIVHCSIHLRCALDLEQYQQLLSEQEALHKAKYPNVLSLLPGGRYYHPQTRKDTIPRVDIQSIQTTDELLED